MKTISLKKVSAVAVAALGFGLLSVVPAQALTTTACTATNLGAGTTGTVEANEFHIVQGAWSAGVFTVGTSLTTGADSLILYDGSSAANVQIQGIVLIGVTNTEEGSIVNTAGVLTVFGA